MMKYTVCLAFTLSLLVFFNTPVSAENQWQELFNGKNLDGWTAKEHPESFAVEEGSIICTGERGHLYYTGPIGNMNIKNFELKVVAKTEPGSNSGIYFHTFPQESG